MRNAKYGIRNAERPRALLCRAITLLLPLLLLFGLLQTLHAQANVGSYTVQPGDTLFVIAQQFGVTVEELVTLNQLTDANVLQVGQVLLIPATTGASAALANVPTVAVPAKPGETLLAVATRYSQEVSLLAALNQMTSTTQLFPGQPVRLPLNQPLPIPLRFGAVRRVVAPDEVVQGHTGRLLIESSRAVSLTVAWNALPIPLVALDGAGKQFFALLPTSALAEVGTQSLIITYTAANGRLLVHTQPITVVDGGYASQTIELPPDRTALLDPTLLSSETQKIAVIWAQVSPQHWSNGPLQRPIGEQYATTSPFGTRRVYNNGLLNGYHAGQDFGASEGITVTVPATGVVVLAEPLQVRGNAVIIDHGQGVFTGYWHLSKIFVQPGQAVAPGDLLGLVGNTGLSTGAHLHWEMHIYGMAVDPLQFLTESFIQ